MRYQKADAVIGLPQRPEERSAGAGLLPRPQAADPVAYTMWSRRGDADRALPALHIPGSVVAD